MRALPKADLVTRWRRLRWAASGRLRTLRASSDCRTQLIPALEALAQHSLMDFEEVRRAPPRGGHPPAWCHTLARLARLTGGAAQALETLNVYVSNLLKYTTEERYAASRGAGALRWRWHRALRCARRACGPPVTGPVCVSQLPAHQDQQHSLPRAPGSPGRARTRSQRHRLLCRGRLLRVSGRRPAGARPGKARHSCAGGVTRVAPSCAVDRRGQGGACQL